MLYKCLTVAIISAASFLPLSTVGQTTAPTPKLGLPIACEIGRTCEVQNYVDRDPSAGAKDFLCGTISYNDHSGVDFRLLDMAAQRQGVNVLAAAPGRVRAVRDGVADVSVKSIDRATIAGRECGNGVVLDHGGGLTTQYCHMGNGSIVVREGATIRAGDPVGQVGLSGNTEYPHLHFTVRRGTEVVDPFAPSASAAGTCGGGASMWQPNVARSLPYKAGVILNAGFASSSLTMAQIEAGGIASPTRNSPALVAYVRAINLKVGDVQQFTLKGPNGATLATHAGTPMTSSQAQRFVFIGKNKPPNGWPAGRYSAEFAVIRAGRPIMQRQFDLRL